MTIKALFGGDQLKEDRSAMEHFIRIVAALGTAHRQRSPSARLHNILFSLFSDVANRGGLLALGGVTLLSGCAASTELGINAPTNTPEYYSENHAFYLEDLDPSKQHSALTRRLKHLYEFDYKKDESGEPFAGGISPLAIHDGSPLGVIVSGVRIPEDLPGGTRDLAVVIDVVTSTKSEPQSLVVYYQRDVPAGQMLNFENLLVYFDPEWDSTTPPYFRLRIIDAYNERNSRIQAMLDRIGTLGASISGLLPHEIIPIVGVAQEAAKLLLGNRNNKTLLDYQVQFYSTLQAASSGGADIGVLRAGAWIVMGRPMTDSSGTSMRHQSYDKPQPRTTSKPAIFDNLAPDAADFWREPVDVDRKTHQLLHAETGRPVYAPYVLVVVSSADVQVPKHVMDRAAELVKLLSTAAGKSDTGALEGSLGTLTKSIEAFGMKRRLTRYRDLADLEALIQTLAANIPPVDATERLRWKAPLDMTEQTNLLRFVNSIVQEHGGGPYADLNALKSWWDETGRKGVLVATPGVHPGVRWEAKKTTPAAAAVPSTRAQP